MSKEEEFRTLGVAIPKFNIIIMSDTRLNDDTALANIEMEIPIINYLSSPSKL